MIALIGVLGWVIYDFAISDSNSKKPTTEVENETTAIDSDEEFGLEKGDLAPDFELETIDGETIRLSDFHGEKVLLNFWATWCLPCRAEMPDMQQYHEEHDVGVLLRAEERRVGTNS